MKRVLFLFFSLFLTCNIFSQSQYLGYLENCVEIQTIKLDSILRDAIGSNRYEQLFVLNHCKREYNLKVVLEIDSTGMVKCVNIIDEKDFLLKEEKEIFISKISQTIFDICFDTFEAKHLSLKDLLNNRQTIRYGLFLPFKK